MTQLWRKILKCQQAHINKTIFLQLYKQIQQQSTIAHHKYLQTQQNQFLNVDIVPLDNSLFKKSQIASDRTKCQSNKQSMVCLNRISQIKFQLGKQNVIFLDISQNSKFQNVLQDLQKKVGKKLSAKGVNKLLNSLQKQLKQKKQIRIIKDKKQHMVKVTEGNEIKQIEKYCIQAKISSKDFNKIVKLFKQGKLNINI